MKHESEYVGDTAETREQVIARRLSAGWRYIGGFSQCIGTREHPMLLERLDFVPAAKTAREAA